MRKCLFLDRDGVINVDFGYVCSMQRLKFVDGIFDLCRKFIAEGFLIVVITNQSGIARGYYSENDFNEFMDQIIDIFKLQGIHISDYLYCPHHPIYSTNVVDRNCDCRKPNNKLFKDAIAKHNITPEHSVSVGDSVRDVIAAASSAVRYNFLIDVQKNESPVNDGCFVISSLYDIDVSRLEDL